MEGYPTRVAPGTASNDGRSRAWSAEWQHSGSKTGARRPTPRAQPRCNPFIQSRPDGPPQPRDPTTSSG